MASRSDKMAVTVDNQPLKNPVNEQGAREELDQKTSMGSQRNVTDGYMLKKKSTFKITSITKNNRGGSGEVTINDADGESQDDLDETVESHTEDASSEILDNSKYEDGADQYSPLEDSIGHDTELTVSRDNKERNDVHSTRFKVVKIETKEPFRRGRWTCRDSLDTPVAEKSETKLIEEKDRNSGNSSACSSVHYVEGIDDPAKNPLSTLTFQNIDQTNEGQGNKNVQPIPAMQMPVSQVSQVHWNEGLSHNHVSNIPEVPYNIQTNPTNQTYSQMPIVGMSDANASVSAQLQHQLQLMNHMNTGNVSAPISTSQSQHFANSAARQLSNIAQLPGQQMPGQQNLGSGQSTSMPVSNHGNFIVASPGTVSMQPVPEPTDPVVNGNVNIFSEYQQTVVDPNSITVTSSKSDDTLTNIVMSDHSSHPPTTLTTQVIKETDSLGISSSAQLVKTPSDSSDQKSVDTVLSHTLVSSSHINPDVKENPATKSKSPIQTCLDQQIQSQNLTPILTPSAVAEVVGGIASPAADVDESGSSTVAIDNKIEQAMDLVKSHLMYAVREEIEELKEQIKQLIDKNSQLEYENNILKSAASPETLSKLTQPRPSLPPASSS